jgi:hypothetical protein
MSHEFIPFEYIDSDGKLVEDPYFECHRINGITEDIVINIEKFERTMTYWDYSI